MTQPSKFSGMFAALGQEEEPKTESQKKAPAKKPRATTAPTPTPAPVQPAEAPRRGRGRPRGKRSDAKYSPTTILIDDELKWHVRTSLMLHEKSLDRSMQDLSGLVEELLREWLKDYPAFPILK